MEAQMAEEVPDADSESVATTAKPGGGGLLSRLNPINKITYKINTARNVVNKALNVVGLGKKSGGGSEASSGDPSSGGEQNDESATRDASSSEGGDETGDGKGTGVKNIGGNIVTLFSLIILLNNILR